MRPCDTVVKRPLTSTHLLPLYYTERQPSHNLIYTPWTTLSVTLERNPSAHARIRLRMPRV